MSHIRGVAGAALLWVALSAGAADTAVSVPKTGDGAGGRPAAGWTARIERSFHEGLERTQHALRAAGRTVGHAVATGLHASGHALQRVGEKLDAHT